MYNEMRENFAQTVSITLTFVCKFYDNKAAAIATCSDIDNRLQIF